MQSNSSKSDVSLETKIRATVGMRVLEPQLEMLPTMTDSDEKSA